MIVLMISAETATEAIRQFRDASIRTGQFFYLLLEAPNYKLPGQDAVVLTRSYEFEIALLLYDGVAAELKTGQGRMREEY